jgi:hypothetical protein
MHVLFARLSQPALLLVIAAAALLLVIAVLLLAGVLGGAAHGDLLVGPFRWEPVSAKLV